MNNISHCELYIYKVSPR